LNAFEIKLMPEWGLWPIKVAARDETTYAPGKLAFKKESYEFTSC